MDISEVPEQYRQNHDIAADTFKQLANVAKLVRRFAGGMLDCAELSPDLANRWLLARKDSGVSPYTVKGNRISLLMLWREAHDLGHAPPVAKIRTIKVPDIIPVAFTREELAKLIAACKSLAGKFKRIPIHRSLYFESLFDATYDSALRLGDVLSIERSWIWPGGFVSIVQKKTGHSHRVQLRAATMDKIERCMAEWPGRALIWPQFSCDRKRVYEYVRRLVRIAGIRRGTSKWIRRSSASYIALEHGEAAAQDHLGHRTAGLARKSYIDPNIVRKNKPLPPPLPDAG